MGIWKAILAGQLIVNVPAVGIMLAVMFLGEFIVPWPFALLGGSLFAWVWWSYTVPRWRNWAIAKGIDPHRLQKYAVRTGLTWPKGSPFEKTEFRKGK
jgi:hypothetical protein